MTTPQTTPLTYNGYVAQVATMAVVNYGTITNVSSNSIVVGTDTSPTSPTSPFNTILPQMLNYAELRIQRDLDLLPSLTSNTSYSLTAGSNLLQLQTNDFVTVQTVSILNGTANTPLVPTSKEYIQNTYNDSSSLGTPRFFAMYGGDLTTGGTAYNNIIVGPYPSVSYPLTITGTVRLKTLYPAVGSDGWPTLGTGTTFISTYYPDMLLMASMIYISAYQRDFGAVGNDTQMPGTYEAQYEMLLKGSSTEEARKRFASAGWTSMAPAPAASLPR